MSKLVPLVVAPSTYELLKGNPDYQDRIKRGEIIQNEPLKVPITRHPSAPPYSVAKAHKVIADFEHAVRGQEMVGTADPEERPGIEAHYKAEYDKMFARLTEPTISTRIKK